MLPHGPRSRGGLVAVLVFVIACAPRDSNPNDTLVSTGAVVPDTPAAVVAVQPPGGPTIALTVSGKPGVGVFLVDSGGRAVYVLEEVAGAPAGCTGDCANAWTPVPGRAAPMRGDTSVSATRAGSSRRADGTEQATYDGKPLYYYRDDSRPNDTHGQATSAGGTTGRLVRPDGQPVTGKGKRDSASKGGTSK